MQQLLEFIGNHPLLCGGVIAAAVAVLVYEMRLRGQTSANVSTTDAVRLLNKGAKVIDVRSPEQYQAGHIVNARNVRVEDLENTNLGKNRQKVVLTVCERGVESARAANILRKAGYEQAFSIRGGMNSWKSDNMPVVK